MHLTLVREPFHRRGCVYEEPGWVYEEKVDGWRIIAYKTGARVHLVRRNAGHQRSRRRRRPGIATPHRLQPADPVILTGELDAERLVAGITSRS
jgi:ATP-dependent DNA ligase